MEESKRPEWTSQFAFIISAIGSTVGLGNIWRFPYIMGKNGGAIFLVTYLFLIFFICIIPLIAEIFIGKTTKKDNIGAYKSINKWLEPFGWLNVITATLVMSFYFIVGGWIINYILASIINTHQEDFGAYFTNLISNSTLGITLTLIFTALCAYIAYKGVSKGIETANKFMVPAFGIIMLILAFISIRLPNSELGLKFMFEPDFSKISIKMILMALGQALFTLSIGMGGMIIYGSYLNKQTNIVKNTIYVVVFDTFFALLAGIMIFCAVFSFGLEPSSGAGLVFITLPQIFNQIPNGNIVSFAFFILLFFAAMTSAISMFEVQVAGLIENLKMTRKKATFISFSIVGLLSAITTLSLSGYKGLMCFGKNLFDIFDYVTSNCLLPFNTLLVCIIVGWFLNIKKDSIFKNEFLGNLFIFMVKFVLPIIIIGLIIYGNK